MPPDSPGPNLNRRLRSEKPWNDAAGREFESPHLHHWARSSTWPFALLDDGRAMAARAGGVGMGRAAAAAAGRVDAAPAGRARRRCWRCMSCCAAPKGEHRGGRLRRAPAGICLAAARRSEYPQSPARMQPATARFYEAVVNGGLTHSGDSRLARHVGNAVLREDARGARLAKEHRDSKRRVDAAVAAVMAHDRAAILAGTRDWGHGRDRAVEQPTPGADRQPDGLDGDPPAGRRPNRSPPPTRPL